jgi:hypothetical protein
MADPNPEEYVRIHPDDYNELVPMGGIVFHNNRAVFADTGKHVMLDMKAPRLKRRAAFGMGLRAKMDVKLTVEKAK